eukprot:TCONS_00068382-protein
MNFSILSCCLIFLLSTFTHGQQNGSTTICRMDQMQYVYTPCDKNDNVWRVQIPSTECLIDQPAKPVKGVKCSTTCQAGEFLDINTQKCEQCQDGYFSVGDGKRFSSWDELPQGFKSRGFSDINSYEKTHKSGKEDPCYYSGWNLKGDYLMSNGSSCRSVLKFETELLKKGNISFTVKSSSDNTLFHVWSEAGGCANPYSNEEITPEDSSESYYTPTEKWTRHTLTLKKGQNTLYFVASHFKSYIETKSGEDYDSQSDNAVLMKDIVVRGYAYSQQCDKCDAGTRSTKGASVCETCPANTFSTAGSSVCQLCPKSQYSPPGSDKCIERKPCTKGDYHQFWDNCKSDKTRKKYEWNDPKTCDETLKGAVKLPADGPLNGTDCLLCKKNYYNEDGRGACKKCPPQTRGAPKFHFKYWKKLPGKMMHLYCLARPETGCKTSQGWTLHDDHISSGLGHADDAELLMYILVPGFTSQKSTFKMTYQVVCPSGNCRLRIQTVEAANLIEDIRKVDGNAERSTITHTRLSSAKTRYRITFEKKYNPNMQTYKYADSTY